MTDAGISYSLDEFLPLEPKTRPSSARKGFGFLQTGNCSLSVVGIWGSLLVPTEGFGVVDFGMDGDLVVASEFEAGVEGVAGVDGVEGVAEVDDEGEVDN